jgi:hypothetical protein
MDSVWWGLKAQTDFAQAMGRRRSLYVKRMYGGGSVTDCGRRRNLGDPTTAPMARTRGRKKLLGHCRRWTGQKVGHEGVRLEVTDEHTEPPRLI